MIDRRRFLVGAVAAPATFHIVASCVLGKEGQTPPSGKLNLAGIGVGGQGGGLMREMGASENVVALCDVDHKYAART
ncbi:MAG TPA: gfo/Idh/MocA family oxidoreductase, partial [Phycisphaerae bacterium]|nr:gfo/Idh/MocA family oxidoreductase [Phycisphaerae bacterium]